MFQERFRLRFKLCRGQYALDLLFSITQNGIVDEYREPFEELIIEIARLVESQEKEKEGYQAKPFFKPSHSSPYVTNNKSPTQGFSKGNDLVPVRKPVSGGVNPCRFCGDKWFHAIDANRS